MGRGFRTAVDYLDKRLRIFETPEVEMLVWRATSAIGTSLEPAPQMLSNPKFAHHLTLQACVAAVISPQTPYCIFDMPLIA